jgi:tape measure domain-containing protein
VARGVEIGRGYIAVDTEDSAARSALRSFSSFAKEAFKATAVAAGIVVGAAAKIGVEFNSMKEQAQVAFTTLLGSGEKAKGLLEDLQKFSAQTPFEMEGLIDNARGLLGVGVEAKKVIPTLTALGNASGALGLNQEAFNRIMLATTQSMAKGKIQGEELLQFAENGIPIFDLLGKALGVPKDQIAKLGSEGKLLSAEVFPKLFDQMQKDYGGAMAAQSKTLAGTWSSLKDNARILAGTGFKPLFDEAKRVVGALGEFAASDKASRFAEAFSGKLDLALKSARAFTQGLRVQFATGEFADAFDSAKLRAERFWDSFADIARNALTTIKNILRQIAPQLSQFGDQIGGLLPAALESAGRVMQTVADNSTELGQALASAMSVFRTIAGPALALFRAAMEATAAVLSSIVKLIASMPDGIGSMVGVLAAGVVAWRLLGGSIGSATKALTLFSTSGTLASGLKGIATKIDDVALSAGVLTERLTGSSKAAGKLLDSGTALSGAFRGLAGAMPAVGGALLVVGTLLALHLTQQHEITAGAERMARGLSEGGRKAKDAADSYGSLQRQLAGLQKQQDALIAQAEANPDGLLAESTGGDLNRVNTEVAALQERIGAVDAEFKNLTATMGPVEKAQAEFNRAVAEFGPYSDQATQASAIWRQALADEAVKNEQAAQATKTHLDKLLELQNAQLGIMNADIGYRQALSQQEVAQQRATEALTAYGSESVQYRDAMLQNESAIDGLINAAGRRALAEAAGQSQTEQTSAAVRAQNAEAVRLAQAMGERAPASLQRFISNMNGAELSALGVTARVNEAGHAVLVMPDGKEVKIVGDNAQALAKIAEVNAAKVHDKYAKLYIDQITRVDQRESQGLGGRAIGGSTRSFTPYLVGERGPELLFEDRSQYVATASQTRSILSASNEMPTSFTLTSGAIEVLDNGLIRIVDARIQAADYATAQAIANRRAF